MTTTTLTNGITYEIKAEVEMTGKMAEQGFYTHTLILVRPKGTKEFWATRDINGTITLN
jgi:hypothetical protein